MPSHNKCTLIGHLGRDAKFSISKNGVSICEFNIAVTTRNGDKEQTLWMAVKCFRGWADNSRNLMKGECVFVSGKLVTEEWNAKEGGEKKSRTCLIAEEVYRFTREHDVPYNKQETVKQPSQYERPRERTETTTQTQDQQKGGSNDELPF